MPKLSKTNSYAILWLNHIGKSVEEIVDELGVTAKQIKDTLPQDTNNDSQQALAPVAKNLMITHTAGKKLNNVAIMTKDASSLVDEERKKNHFSSGRDSDKNIFRPNNK